MLFITAALWGRLIVPCEAYTIRGLVSLFLKGLKHKLKIFMLSFQIGTLLRAHELKVIDCLHPASASLT